jgi:large subunit ribosomal protein L22
MQFVAKTKYVHSSPYKLRPLVNALKGKNVVYALNVLKMASFRRAIPVRKMIASAVANAKYLQNIDPEMLVIETLRVDQGPMHRYYKPGAMGRSTIQRKRLSHMYVVLKSIANKEV